jgi:hypothetical protein
MQNKIVPTDLIKTPDSADLYFVKSENIKVFPSSWRGSELILNGDTLLAGSNLPFNPEATLNTEYNITRTAGAVKTYIDQLLTSKVLNATSTKYIDCYTFKFFINGYAFEILNLNSAGLTDSDSNLFAYIRIGDMPIGENPIDNTQVLMPFTWTSVDTPVSLDTTLRTAYELSNKETDNVDSDVIDSYVFTGLVLSEKPLNEYITAKNAESSYYSIQLIKNGKLCYENCWTTEITAGQETEGKSTLIGEKGLKADVEHMLAVGRFNETTVPATSTSEKTLFVVGNGTDETYRRNVLEVTGSTSPDFIIKNDSKLPVYSQTVKVSEVLEISYDSSAEKDDKGVAITGVDTINTGIEVHPEGTSIIINKDKQDSANLGLLAYGDIIIKNIPEKEFSLSFNDAEDNFIGGIQHNTANDKLDIKGINAINEGFIFTNTNNNDYHLEIGNISDNAKLTLGKNFNITQDGVLSQVTKLNQIFVGNDTLTGISTLESTKVKSNEVETSEVETGRLAVTGNVTVSGDMVVSSKFEVSSNKTIVKNSLTVSSNLTVNKNIEASNISASNLIEANKAIFTDIQVKNNSGSFSIDSSEASLTIDEINASKIDVSEIDSTNIKTTKIDSVEITAPDITTQNIRAGVNDKIIISADNKVIINGNVEINGNCDIASSNSFNCSPESLFTETLRKYIVKATYPVGSVYITSGNEDPYNTFDISTDEWTWEEIKAGHTLVSAGSYNGMSFVAGTQGGSPNTIVPSHKHGIDGTVDPNKTRTSDITYENSTTESLNIIKSISVPHTHNITVNATNSEHKHNIPVSLPINSVDNALYNPANIGHNDATSYYQGNIRQNWWERIYMTDASNKVASTNLAASNLVKERATKLIPTVQLGSWYSPNGVDNTVNWNTHGPVYTGYQKVSGFSTKAAWNNSFDSSWNIFYNYLTNDGYRVLDYVCYDIGETDYGDVLNNDYFGMSDEYYNAKLKSYGIDEKNICDDKAYQTKLTNMHNNYLTDIGNALRAAGITSPVSSQVYKLFNQQLNSILTAVGAKYIFAGTAWNNNLVYPPATRKKYLKHALNKLYVIKEAFFNDYLKSKTRSNDTTADGDSLLDFTCRQDDGAHRHTASSDSANISHKHSLDLEALKPYLAHTHPVADFPKETKENLNGNNKISGTNANYPPYFVCRIWKRIK